MHIDGDSWTKITSEEIYQSLRLSAALKSSWSKDTAYPGDAEKWTTNIPSIGQCAATSLVVQKHVDGDIHRNSRFHHYWNHLPSGAFVDFTREQFKTSEPIESEGIAQRDDLLTSEGAERAKTKQRYEILKKRLKIKMKSLKPTVFLFSSNAQAEYIHDIIETIGVPEGTIQHFRYQLKYVDNALRKLIPIKGEEGSNRIKGMKTIIVYLNQKVTSSGIYKWNDSVPVRMGIIKRCYRTGKGDHSIANFFFEVRESLLKTEIYTEYLPSICGDAYEKAYAFLTFEDTKQMVTKHQASEIFEKQCEKIQEVGLKFVKNGETINYEPPLMVLLEGLFKKRFLNFNSLLKPKYNSFVPNSFYNLKEGKSFYFRFRTYNWEYKKPYQIKLKVSKQLFSTPEEYVYAVNSSYNSECWELTPSFIEMNTSGYMQFEVQAEKPNQEKKPASIELDWKIFTMFRLKRKISLIIFDTFSDLLFALGPVYIAATKLFENVQPKPYLIEFWPQGLILIYSLWGILKIIRRSIGGS